MLVVKPCFRDKARWNELGGNGKCGAWTVTMPQIAAVRRTDVAGTGLTKTDVRSNAVTIPVGNTQGEQTCKLDTKTRTKPAQF